MLTCRNIHKIYNQKASRLEVLRGIDLEVKEGEIVAVVGPSGAGKSTLLHILGGLDFPDQGQVNLDGDDIYRLSDGRRTKIRNRKIGFIFQFYHLLPEFTALENVLLPALVAGLDVPMAKSQGKAKELLSQVGLAGRVTHKPNQLSGGEQQRVAIARSLMNDPKIVFCDEPTGNLDSASGHEILDLLVRLNKEKTMTLVIVTHDEMIARMAGRVIHMRDGILAD